MRKKSDLPIDFINFVECPYDESISYPMGILSLSSYLKKCGFSNIGFVEHICTLRRLAEKEEKPLFFKLPKKHISELHESAIDRLFVYLKERNPRIILLGPITTLYLVELVDLARKIRGRFPENVVLAGGPHFGKDPHLDEELLKYCPELDGLAVGESEETIAEVVEQFYSEYPKRGKYPSRVEFHSQLAGIPGIQTQDSKFLPRDLPNLEKIPPPDIGLLEEYWKSQHVIMNYNYSLSHRRNPIVKTERGYFQGEGDWGYIEDEITRFPTVLFSQSHFPFGVIVGSRGCPYRCSFCCSSGPRRVLSARYIFDRIYEMYNRYGIRHFVFFESLFTTAPERKRVGDLCKMLSTFDLHFEYIIDIRADIVSELPEELLAEMIRTGFVEFNLGLEKGSDKCLEEMTKGTRIEQHFTAVEKLRRAAKEAGNEIFVNGTFILGGPKETKSDIRDVLIHCWSLNLDESTFYILQVYPGTQIYSEALKEDILEPGLRPYLNPEKFPLYETVDLSVCYLNYIQELNERTMDDYREFKKTILEIESQFVPEQNRYSSSVDLHETKELHGVVRRFIDESLDYLRKHQDEGLMRNGDIVSPLQVYLHKVEEEIRLLEERLLQKYPDYDPWVENYQLGTLINIWKRFSKQFVELFTKENNNVK